MSNFGVGLRSVYPMAAAASNAPATPTAATPATDFPAGTVHVARQGTKLAMNITGGIAALGGATLLGVSLLHGNIGGATSRLLAAPLVIGGGLIAAGAGAMFATRLVSPKAQAALATKIPTADQARTIAATFTGHNTEVVRDELDGTFAVLDRGTPRSSGGGYSGGYGGGYNSGRNNGYGNGGYYYPTYPDNGGYYPSYPSDGGYYPDPSYPTGGYGSTSPGDDYGSSYPSSGGSTSSGDDYSSGGSSYDPPSYDPPSYDPPSYDPPSYDPPSSGGSDYSGGYSDNSSSNGNPSDSDF
jgi:hypothetical protein